MRTLRTALGRRCLTTAVTAALFTLSACASPTAGAPDARSTGADAVGGVAQANPTDPAPILATWQSFPVTARPRPIVLLGEPAIMPGFTTDAAKVAASERFVVLNLPVPAPPPRVAVTLPDGPALLPTVGAGPALARFADGRPTIPEKMPEPLVITGVQLGTATFPTDRGPLALPAWLFSLPQATGALAVPALADSAFWHLGDVPPAATAASLVGGLAVQIAQPPATACPGEPIYRYDVVAAESPTAVVVQLRKTQTGVAAGSPQPCDQPLFLRLTAYPVHLVDPLGNRVLLDPFGRVYQVSTTLSLPD